MHDLPRPSAHHHPRPKPANHLLYAKSIHFIDMYAYGAVICALSVPQKPRPSTCNRRQHSSDSNRIPHAHRWYDCLQRESSTPSAYFNDRIGFIRSVHHPHTDFSIIKLITVTVYWCWGCRLSPRCSHTQRPTWTTIKLKNSSLT